MGGGRGSAAAFGVLLSCLPAAAQSVPSPRVDSAAVVEMARQAQGRFERDRIRLLPRDRWGFSGGSCDERVGRMCLRLEGGSDWWWPEVENPELARARDDLIEALGEAAEALPGDSWILGQRVIYLGEAGRWDEAERVARRCGPPERWWCDALEGLARHVRGDYGGAVVAFERALAAMDPVEAARWRDVEVLLTGDGRDARERALERGDSSATARFWRLSDPLFLVPGNDRYTEHLARRTWSLTREGARNPYAMSWGWDLDRLLVRYGWEVGWERRDPGAGSIGVSASAVGHQNPQSLGYVAPAAVWDASPESAPEDWNPGSRTRPRTGYAPAYAPTFLDLATTVGLLPRGDSALVVVRVPGMPEDTTFHGGHDHPAAPDPTAFAGAPPVHGLYVADLSDGGWVRGVSQPGLEGTLTLSVPAGNYVVSVETWDPQRSRAARLRRGLRVPRVPRDVAALSDLLVARARGGLPASLEAVADDLVEPAVFAPGDTVRVVWEVHGLGWQPESLGYTLDVREEAGGLFSRLGRTVGLVGDRRGVGLAWTEAGPDAPGPAFRAVDLVLPPRLEGGRFRLRLELASPGRGDLVAERELEVRSDPGRR